MTDFVKYIVNFDMINTYNSNILYSKLNNYFIIKNKDSK